MTLLDKRIKLFINKCNIGPSATRNRGLDIATGKFVAFIDHDDSYQTGFLETMIKTALKNDAEIVWCQFNTVGKDKVPKALPNKFVKNKIVDSTLAIRSFFDEIPGQSSLWNKIYERTFLNNLRHPRLNIENVRAEDWEFNLFAMKEVKRLVAIDDVLYNYYVDNENSVIRSFRMQDYYNIYRSIEILKDINNELNLGYTEERIINLNIFFLIEFVYRAICRLKYQEIYGIYKEERFRKIIANMDYNKFPVTYKLLLFFIKHKFYFSSYLLFKTKHRVDGIIKSMKR